MRFFFSCLLLCLFTTATLTGQDKPKTITLKKGQAFDIILLNNDPKAKDALQDYFKRAYPLAQADGYVPGSGFGIIGTPTMGNYRPEVLATGTWPSIAARVEALKKLETGMSDFHEMRRKVWPSFNMTYYEVKEDISFTTDPAVPPPSATTSTPATWPSPNGPAKRPSGPPKRQRVDWTTPGCATSISSRSSKADPPSLIVSFGCSTRLLVVLNTGATLYASNKP